MKALHNFDGQKALMRTVVNYGTHQIKESSVVSLTLL